MSDTRQPTKGRALLLPVMLGSIVGIFCLLALVVMTGGFFLYFLLVIGAFASVALMHFLLWGRALETQTEGDREEASVLDRAREELQHRTWTPRS
jgi:membrane protein implicated in regulation of membrane protease activity